MLEQRLHGLYRRLVQGHNGLAYKVLQVLLVLVPKRSRLGRKPLRLYKRLVPKGNNLVSKHLLV